VLYANDHLGWGRQIHGVTRLFETWGAHLDPVRYQAEVLVVRNQPELAAGLRARGIPVRFLAKGKYDPSALPAFARFVRDRGIDLLHVQSYGATTLGRLVGRWLGIPVVVHFHDTTPNYPLLQRLSDRLLGGLTSRFLAVSGKVREVWAPRAGVSPDRILVLPNCVELGAFAPPEPARAAGEKERLGLPRDAPVVGVVTRLFEEKGTRHFVQAMPAILAARPEARFVIVGDGPLRGALEAQAVRLGVGDRVRFTGFVPEVRGPLAAMDVFVLTSCFAEGGVPLPVIEAMAMGRPVVVTDLVEIVQEGVNGFVVAPGDPAAIADRVLRLLARPEERRRLVEAGLVTAREHDVGAYMERLQALYDGLF
jgi:glycosyltransferase involved in cell wall biosynthesis